MAHACRGGGCAVALGFVFAVVAHFVAMYPVLTFFLLS